MRNGELARRCRVQQLRRHPAAACAAAGRSRAGRAWRSCEGAGRARLRRTRAGRAWRSCEGAGFSGTACHPEAAGFSGAACCGKATGFPERQEDKREVYVAGLDGGVVSPREVLWGRSAPLSP